MPPGPGDLMDVVRDAGLVPAQGAEELALRNYVLPCSDPETLLDSESGGADLTPLMR